MSSMPKTTPEHGPDRAFVRHKIAALEKELGAWKQLDSQLLSIEEGTGGPGFNFAGLKPYEAICEFLKIMGKPQTREAIMNAVIKGGTRLGVLKEKSVNQSISTNVGLGKIKELNGLVGLTEWPDSMFQ